MQRLPSTPALLPGRFETGRKKASPKQRDGERGQVRLIPLLLMSSQDGNKDARMVCRSTRKSKRRDTQGRIEKCIASWCRCAETNESFKREQCLMLPCKISPPRTPSGCLCVIQPGSMSKSKPLLRLFV